jgi:hypothetical protein
MALEASKLSLEESHNLDIAKLKNDRDIAQSVANDLRLQNEKLNLILMKQPRLFLALSLQVHVLLTLLVRMPLQREMRDLMSF